MDTVFTVAAECALVQQRTVPGVHCVNGIRLGLLVSIAVLDGYGIHIRSRINARWFNGGRYPTSIVFMEFHPRLLVSIVVLDGYGIHIRSKNECASVQ